MPDPREYRDVRDPRDHREREMRDMRDGRDPRDMREMRDPRDMRDIRDIRGGDPRDMRERDPRELRMHPHPSQHPSHPQQHHSAYPHPSHSSQQSHSSHPHPSHSSHPAHPSHSSHPSHASHPSHQSHPSLSHPSQHPAPYGSQHAYHHSSNRHSVSGPGAGLGMQGMGGPPPGMIMNGPPPEQGLPPSNGHGHAPPSAAHSHREHRSVIPSASAVTPASARSKEKMDHMLGNLTTANENTWMLMGAVAEHMQDTDRAMSAFENALRHNPNSVIALTSAANIARNKDQFDKAIEYFQRVLNIKQDNGEVWGSMGHCLLMKDDLPKAYTAYQQALYHLQNPKEPKLWYGIGILYDRYGSFEHAEEAFSSVLKMDPNFEKANEIYFRLGIIYKHQRKYTASLECFRYILDNPPRPLTHFDIWFQLGHVYEQDRDYENAKSAYMRVLTHQPDHAKVLQQLGWLYHQPGAAFADQEKAVTYLTRSLETDGADAQSWYLLGRAFMAGQRYNKAYEAYQQAVYRDGRNPTFWCSIGVLYYQINQYRDALDAYSRAIRLNPYIPEVWYNLGSLYESCNNQVTDAIDAYSRATELDSTNQVIKHRLALLQGAGGKNSSLPPAPGPVDVHPSQYAATPTNGPQQAMSPRATPPDLIHDRPERPPTAVRPTPPAPAGAAPGGPHGSPGPFRGGIAPPPLNHVDETRGSMSRHAPLAPIEMERPDLAPGGERPPQPSNGRPDDRSMDRRQLASPGPPRRPSPAEGGREYGFPQYPPPPGAAHMREREPRNREEWEARERRNGPGMPPGPPHPHGQPMMDPRGPVHRQPIGGPQHHPKDLGRGPSPRIPSDSRDPRDGYYYPPSQSNDDRRRYDERAMLSAQPHPAAPREIRLDDPRAPSPAPSNSSRASKRTRDSAGPGPMKRAKEDKAGSGGAKRNSQGGKEKKEGKKSGAKSPVLVESAKPAAAGGRTINEDYDEGVDALMALHGDRPSNHGSVRASSVGSTAAPPAASPTTDHHEASHTQSSAIASALPETGAKRSDPSSPRSPSTVTAKKPKAGPSNASSPAGSHAPPPKKTIVIEVLNAENVRSPATSNGTGSGTTPNGNGVATGSYFPRNEERAAAETGAGKEKEEEPRAETPRAASGGAEAAGAIVREAGDVAMEDDKGDDRDAEGEAMPMEVEPAPTAPAPAAVDVQPHSEEAKKAPAEEDVAMEEAAETAARAAPEVETIPKADALAETASLPESTGVPPAVETKAA